MGQVTEQLAQRPGPEGPTASDIQRPLGAVPPPLSGGGGAGGRRMAAIIFYLKTVTSPAECTRHKTISLRGILNSSQICSQLLTLSVYQV